MTDTLVEAVARAMRDWSDEMVDEWNADNESDINKFNARAALAAIETQGFVILPKEPTPAMLVHASGFRTGEHIYAAFLSARPKQASLIDLVSQFERERHVTSTEDWNATAGTDPIRPPARPNQEDA